MAAAAAAAVDDTPVAQPTTTSGDADEPTTSSGDAPTLQRYVGLEHMHPLQLQALYAASRFERVFRLGMPQQNFSCALARASMQFCTARMHAYIQLQY